MPMTPKSFWPALAGFLGAFLSTHLQYLQGDANQDPALSFTYTAVVARGEGNTIDAARKRWQDQKKRGDAAMSAAGSKWLEEHKHE